MIRLTDDELDKQFGHNMYLAKTAAKAQLRKVAIWRLEQCPHFNDDTIKGGCGQCWNDLLEEVKE